MMALSSGRKRDLKFSCLVRLGGCATAAPPTANPNNLVVMRVRCFSIGKCSALTDCKQSIVFCFLPPSEPRISQVVLANPRTRHGAAGLRPRRHAGAHLSYLPGKIFRV